ncbi:unnamed protein product, partial [Brassica oleracea var. botrytis]
GFNKKYRLVCVETACGLSTSSSDDAKERSASMRKLCFVVVLCILFMSIEVVGGIKANSLAILTNATHLLTDVAAFSISMLSLWASSWEANPRQSYGFFRIEILGALVSIQLIWLLTGILVYEAITRLIQQTNDDVDGFFMVLVAAFGLVVNIIMIVVLGHDHGNGHCHSHSHNHEHGHGVHDHDHGHGDNDEQLLEKPKEGRNINVQGAYLHVLGDLIQSIGVMIGGRMIWYNPKWKIIDHICTLVFSIIVLGTTLHWNSFLTKTVLGHFRLLSLLQDKTAPANNISISSLLCSASLTLLTVTKNIHFLTILFYCSSSFLDRKADARSLEVQGFKEAQRFAFKEEEEESMQDTVPFLQMLQSEEPSFLRLLSLQNLKEPWEVESFLSQEGHPHFYQNQVSALYIEGAKQALSSQEADMILLHSSSPQHKRKNSDLLAPDMTREKRKRRKTKPSKNIEEIENQRINHIHPFVGGAIHYAKVLEQIIQSLESQKRTQQSSGVENRVREDETRVPSIETTVVQNHVNLKVVCRKRQGELIRGIISLEKLRLTVLHLNISTLSRFYVSCCFNLKVT